MVEGQLEAASNADQESFGNLSDVRGIWRADQDAEGGVAERLADERRFRLGQETLESQRTIQG